MSHIVGDYYTISVTPRPLSHLARIKSPPVSVTIEYDTVHIIDVSAVNCAGSGASGIFKLGVTNGMYVIWEVVCLLLRVLAPYNSNGMHFIYYALSITTDLSLCIV